MVNSASPTELGFSTVEILVALTIAVFTIVSVLVLVFSNEMQSQDASIVRGALFKLHDLIEDEKGISGSDFLALTSKQMISDGGYQLNREVIDLGPCEKRAVNTALWLGSTDSPLQELEVDLADIAESRKRNDTCGGSHFGPQDWKCPTASAVLDLGTGQQVTALDVKDRLAYVATQPGSQDDPDFFIVDVADNLNPRVLSSLHLSPGLNDIDVAGNFVFMANRESTNQLMVVDATDPTNPNNILEASRTLPGVIGVAPQGLSLFYYDSKIYIGTHRTAGREFHIYDVTNPKRPAWLGSSEINHNLNQIIVRDQVVEGQLRRFAFFAASGNAKDIMVYDVTDPTMITLVTTVDLLGDEDGRSIYVLGERLFVGRFSSSSISHPGVYIVDVSNPLMGLTLTSSVYAGKTDINSVFGTGRVLFTAGKLAGDQIQIWQTPARVGPLSRLNGAFSNCRFANAFSGDISSLDMENGFLYAGLGAGHGLVIIRP